jgi:PAS domain S-box-containing protein
MDSAYKTYFDSMPCFVSVQDADLRIVDVNKRFVSNFGEHEGRFCYQVYKQRPEKCENCPVERTFRDGEPHRSEELVKALDGREIWVVVQTAPIIDNGRISRVMEMSTDITDIKMLHRHLRHSQEKYRLLFEEVPCFISIQDKDLSIVEANRLHREAFGTAYGSKCFKVYKHREKACDPCIVRDTFADGVLRTHEEVVTSSTGERMNVMVTTAPVRNSDGGIDSVIEMSTDITQIRELQSKLSSVGMIISTISHDLKGLLNGMDGGIYLVETGLKKNDQARIKTGWEMVLRNMDRVRSTVLDILYYAKDREPQWESVSARQVVEEVCAMMHSKAEQHSISLSQTIESAADSLEADPRALKSLLVNLIDNSIDACRLDRAKEAHTVSVKVAGSSESVIFEVADNGIGMERDVREKAFSLFFSSKGAGGTGLGLFIANKIAQSHGGSIELESEPNLGTKFVVNLPRRKPESIPVGN